MRRTALRTFLQKPFTQTCFGTVIIALAALLLPAPSSPAIAAREDSARLVFQKSAGPRKTRLYVVKKGNSLPAFSETNGGMNLSPLP